MVGLPKDTTEKRVHVSIGSVMPKLADFPLRVIFFNSAELSYIKINIYIYMPHEYYVLLTWIHM